MGTRRIEVTFERTEKILTRRTRAGDTWCAACQATVRMLAPGEAATLVGVTARIIYQWVEARRVHSSESAEGETLICLNSLLRTAHETARRWRSFPWRVPFISAANEFLITRVAKKRS